MFLEERVMNVRDRLERDRKALSDIHIRVGDLNAVEYNALVHAIWAIDGKLRELEEVI